MLFSEYCHIRNNGNISVHVNVVIDTLPSIQCGNVWWVIFTHSSLVRSCVSFTRSLKHPKEYMLSRTSGSSSVKDRILFTHTRRGGGCSGQGSLRPLLTGKTSMGLVCANTKHLKVYSNHWETMRSNWGTTYNTIRSIRAYCQSYYRTL